MKPHTPESIAAIRAAIAANVALERPIRLTRLAARLKVALATIYTAGRDLIALRQRFAVTAYEPRETNRDRHIRIPGPLARVAGIRRGDRLLHRVLGHGAILTRVMHPGEALDGVGEPWNGGL